MMKNPDSKTNRKMTPVREIILTVLPISLGIFGANVGGEYGRDVGGEAGHWIGILLGALILALFGVFLVVAVRRFWN